MDWVLMVFLPIIALLCMAADVVMFFVVVRLLRRVWSPRWIVAFDAAGSDLVDCALQVVTRAAPSGVTLREPVVLMMVVMALLLGRTILAAVSYGLSAVVLGS